MSKTNRRRLLLYTPLVAVLALALLGWRKVDRLQGDAELLAETGRAAIALLKELSSGIHEGDLDRVAACYADSYANPEGGTWTARLESERDGIEVLRWTSASPRPASEGGTKTDAKAEAIEQVRRVLAGAGTLEQTRLKLARVEEISAPGKAVIRSVLWLRGTDDEGTFETFARLRMAIRQEETGWKIESQELLDGETVRGPRAGFGDVAAEAGIDFRANRNPLFATEEWYPHKFGILKFGSAGVSAADYDGDGWPDLFFADGEAPRLFRNLGDGTFEDSTEAAGLPKEMLGANVGVFADFDNDGDRDLFVGVFTGENRLFESSGHGTFTEVTEGAGLGGTFVTVAAAADYDLDGDLDLYAGRYLDPRVSLPTTMFYTRNGEGNSLLRNDGGLRFTEVTDEAGVREGGLALGVVWGDFDRDGDPDLYAANDFGRNALFENRGDGTFADVSQAAGALDFGFGMSADFGDVDNDGDLDLYVSSIHSGQRWYGQATTLYQYLLTSMRQGTISEDMGLYREIFDLIGDNWMHVGDQMVKGNSLLVNRAGHFTDVTETANTNPFGWYWGSAFLDYDNDGRLDIYAANGWVSGKTYDDL